METNRIKTLLTAVLISLSASISAYDFTVDGLYYNIVSLEDLTCEITREIGYDYTGDIVIPETVTYNNKTLTVVKISDKAFYYCTEMSSITIPNSITDIGEEAFENCSALTSIIIPNTVKHLGKSAFMNCSNLEDVTLSNSLESISDYTFYKCSLLKNISIPNSVNQIGEYAFHHCYNLANVIIPNSVTKINNHAFTNCYKLTQVTIPSSVLYIGDYTFYYCNNLTEIIIEDGNDFLEFESFWADVAFNRESTVFLYCPLKSVYIGRNIKVSPKGNYDYKSLFINIGTLEKVSVGNMVTKINENMFSGCYSLKEISLGNSVNEIGTDAFKECSNLSTIYTLNQTPPIVENETFTNKIYINTNLYVPKGSLAAYQTADVWKNFWNIQEYSPETGIGSITVGSGKEDKIYDLQGRKLETPQHGINIINGKKVLVK